MDLIFEFIGLVGGRGAGKTTFVGHLIDVFRQHHISYAGILSPGNFEKGVKTSILFETLPCGERRVFAERCPCNQADFRFGVWGFHQTAFDWANAYLDQLSSVPILILDEIGPLELSLGQGLQAGLQQLKARKYDLAIVTFRPKCISEMQSLFPGIDIVNLLETEVEAIKSKIFRVANAY